MRYFYIPPTSDFPLSQVIQTDGNDVPAEGSEIGGVWAGAFSRAIIAKQSIDPDAIVRAIHEFQQEPEVSAQRQINLRRQERDRLVRDTDWIESPNAQRRVGPGKTAALMAYREALFDLDMTKNDWPEMPA